jgi:salicylate 1-O-methyltransferase
MYKDHPERFENTKLPFAIAEYGCATGASSTAPIAVIIEEVRAINPAMPIIVYLNDMPDNHHSLAIDTVTKGLAKYANVFVYVAGYDFTHQIFPENSIDISFSSLTAMILPEAPVPIENNLFFLAAPETLETAWG